MNEIITARDSRAIDFVSRFGAVSLSQLAASVYPSPAVARRRLRILSAHRLLARYRTGCNGEYIYYVGRRPPAQEAHRMALVDVYNALVKLGGTVETWQKEPQWEGVRPDAYCVYVYHNRKIHFAVEIERQTNPFNQTKYETLLSSGARFSTSFPMVLVVGEKPPAIKPSRIRFIWTKPDMSGINQVLGGVFNV